MSLSQNPTFKLGGVAVGNLIQDIDSTISLIYDISGNLQTQIDNISGGLENIVEDLTPQLGGNLDPNGKFIAGDLIPSIDDTHSLGVSGISWKNLYLSDSIYVGEKRINVEDGKLKLDGENLDDWILDAGTLKPVPGTAPNGLSIGTESETFTATGDTTTGDFENAGANISYVTDHWENDIVVESASFNDGNYNTNATTPYTVTTGTVGGAYPPYMAFDGVLNDTNMFGATITPSVGAPLWMKIDLGSGNAKTFGAYRLFGRTGTPTTNPRDWTLQGSNNDADWDVLDTRSLETVVGAWTALFTVASPASYRYYKFNITANNGYTGYTNLVELSLREQNIATSDNTVDTIMTYTGTKNFAPATVVVEDENGDEILGTGKINLSYNINEEGFTSLIDLQSFKEIPVDNFALADSFSIKVQPVGTQKFTDVIISTPNSEITLSPSGNFAINVNGVPTVTINADGTTSLVPDFTQLSSNLVPISGDTYSLGTSGASWNDLYVNNINGTPVSSLADFTQVSSNIVPTVGDTYSLGTSGSTWNSLYVSEINGIPANTVEGKTSDYAATAENAGKMWMRTDAETSTLKIVMQAMVGLTTPVWSAGNNISTATSTSTIFGSLDASVYAGGSTGSNTAVTEEFDGTNWSAGGNLPSARNSPAGSGSLTAGVVCGGYTSEYTNATFEYDGSSYSTVNNMLATRGQHTTNGSQTTTFQVGGQDYNQTHYVYDGTSWTADANPLLGLGLLSSAGVLDAALIICGGTSGPVQKTCEEFDGTSWTYGGEVTSARYANFGGGSQTDAFTAGGYNAGPVFFDDSHFYNGTSWSAGPTLNVKTCYNEGGAGDSDGAMIAGGYTTGFTKIASSDIYIPALPATGYEVKTITLG